MAIQRLDFGTAAQNDGEYPLTAFPKLDANDAELETRINAHEAASDPHPQYMTAAETAAAYAPLSHSHTIANVTGLQTALDAKANASTNTGDQNVFATIAVAGQSNVVADSTSDTLTLVAGANVTITTDAATDSITIAAAGAGGGATVADGDYGDIVVTGSGSAWAIDSSVLTTFGRSLINDADAATARTTLGLGTLATQSGTLSAFGATLIDDADAATARATLGAGDVTAAAAFATDNRIIRSDGTGKGVQVSSITVDDSGQIGINQVAPSAKLEIVESGAADIPAAKLQHRGNVLRFMDANPNYYGSFGFNNNTALLFFAFNAEHSSTAGALKNDGSGTKGFALEKTGTGVEVKFNSTATANAQFASPAINQHYGDTGEVFFPATSTTASAANAFLDSGSFPANKLLRSTSSVRYKTAIEDMWPGVGQSLLNLRPIFYRSKAEADNPAHSFYGFLAEEVAAIDPRFAQWGYTEDAFEIVEKTITVGDESHQIKERSLKQGAAKVPDGVCYDRLVVPIIQLLKEQNAKLEAALARIAALEAAP